MIGGRYTVVRLIARGGVGLVYLARQAVSNNAVVVKVLAANLVGDEEASARFEREAQRLRSMQHPNIVAMVDYGHANGSAYLVMEYLQGELLSAYAARKGPLSLADFTPIAAQILKAIGHAHSQGLMHRDLKPSNIMLCTRKGRGNFVKILDFGMAKLIEGERDITSEQIVGTANYLSPEQIKGEPIDARVDVYAIGITFYMLLAGRLPFAADNNAALLYKHVHEAPPPLAGLLPPGHDIAPALIDLIHRCLAKDPADRPLDANAIVAGLVACVPGELFHLPVAEGGAATPSSSYEVLPANVEPGPEELSGRLTRPVQALRAAQTGPSAAAGASGQTGSHPRTGQTGPNAAITAGRMRTRTRNRVPVVRPVTGPIAAPIVDDAPDGGRGWMALAGVVLVALLGLGGFLLSGAGRSTAAADAPAPVDERRVRASLEQVELDILDGNFERARKGLDEAAPRVAELPALRSRVDELRAQLTVASTMSDAQRLEKDGDSAAAVSRYRDVLALQPHHPEARAAIVRLGTPDSNTTTVPRSKPTRPGERPTSSRPVAPAAAPTSTKPTPAKPTPAPSKAEPSKPSGDGLLDAAPKKKPDDVIFLPVD